MTASHPSNVAKIHPVNQLWSSLAPIEKGDPIHYGTMMSSARTWLNLLIQA